jgi:2-polyprenyl-3-methyl-5-hydroxy-6-metoxy-1,4-benzoquinol methylase
MTTTERAISQDARDEADACWLCSSTRSEVWKQRGINRALVPDDMAITDSRYGVTLTLRKCSDCGFIFAEDDEVRALVSLYERLEDTGYEGSQDTRLLQMQEILDLVEKAHPGARTLLDVGAAAGLLVAEARRRGLDAEGVEPSASLVAAAARDRNVCLHRGTFPHPDLAGRRFDVILLVDVIEHVADPVGLLRAGREHLAEGGRMIVITPDVGSVAARLLGPKWWHFRLAHVGYFSRETLTEAARSAGLQALGWRRAKWYFRSGYLADRVARYLPTKGLTRLVRRVEPRLLDIIIPLNLFDSWIATFTPVERSGS